MELAEALWLVMELAEALWYFHMELVVVAKETQLPFHMKMALDK